MTIGFCLLSTFRHRLGLHGQVLDVRWQDAVVLRVEFGLDCIGETGLTRLWSDWARCRIEASSVTLPVYFHVCSMYTCDAGKVRGGRNGKMGRHTSATNCSHHWSMCFPTDGAIVCPPPPTASWLAKGRTRVATMGPSSAISQGTAWPLISRGRCTRNCESSSIHI